MYILTNKEDVIIEISSIYELDEEYRNIKVEGHNIAYGPDEKINMYEVEEIPETIQEQKYCYTKEKGIYKNENYKEIITPEKEIEILKEQVTDLQLALTEIYESGV